VTRLGDGRVLLSASEKKRSAPADVPTQTATQFHPFPDRQEQRLDGGPPPAEMRCVVFSQQTPEQSGRKGLFAASPDTGCVAAGVVSVTDNNAEALTRLDDNAGALVVYLYDLAETRSNTAQAPYTVGCAERIALRHQSFEQPFRQRRDSNCF
jgi:hypothetical protein